MNEVVLMAILVVMILASVFYGVFMAIAEDVERERSNHIYTGYVKENEDEDNEV